MDIDFSLVSANNIYLLFLYNHVKLLIAIFFLTILVQLGFELQCMSTMSKAGECMITSFFS